MTPAHIVVLVLTAVTIVFLVLIELRCRRNAAEDSRREMERSQSGSQTDGGP